MRGHRKRLVPSGSPLFGFHVPPIGELLTRAAVPGRPPKEFPVDVKKICDSADRSDENSPLRRVAEVCPLSDDDTPANRRPHQPER